MGCGEERRDEAESEGDTRTAVIEVFVEKNSPSPIPE